MIGERMDFWHVPLTTVAAELAKNPQAILLKSDYNTLFMQFMMWVHSSFSGGSSLINREKSKIPPHFRFSMSKAIDGRLPKDMQGMGVIGDDDTGKFYPLHLLPKGEKVTDVWNGRTLHIERGEIDGVPTAHWVDGGQPMQLLSRWYGFSFTYPNCEIYAGESAILEDEINDKAMA